ncbi:MAG: hypothetical protein ABUJ92_00065 [Desulfobacterales bacterium]
MDNTEINLAIAKIKEIQVVVFDGDPKVWLGTIESGCGTIDYINDPALILENVIELLDNRWVPAKMKVGCFWRSQNTGEIIRDDVFGKATALAYMEMK